MVNANESNLRKALYDYVVHVLETKNTSPEALSALPDLLDKLL